MFPWSSKDGCREYAETSDDLLCRLFPICRSIMGEGYRASLKIMEQYIPFEEIVIESGETVFDWTVPDEWWIKDAYIKDSSGQRVVDFNESNLHVVNYSCPVHQKMRLEELKSKLHSIPELPDAIPYLTTYYKRDWGFCLSDDKLRALRDDEYEVCIDSGFDKGRMILGECILPGTSRQEIMLSSYLCHPSMANNELSGPILLALLYKWLSGLDNRHYTYRFYLGPETIGALGYLSLRAKLLKDNLVAGIVLTCCGDNGPFTYKKTRGGDNIIDKMAEHVFRHLNIKHIVHDFFPTGSDDRQFSSPGFNLPVATFMRSMYGTFPEYHTSLDDLSFVTSDYIMQSLSVYSYAIWCLEKNRSYINLKPFGEPFLSRYGLYGHIGGKRAHPEQNRIIRYLLNFSDGSHDLLAIADKMNLPIWEIYPSAEELVLKNLLKEC